MLVGFASSFTGGCGCLNGGGDRVLGDVGNVRISRRRWVARPCISALRVLVPEKLSDGGLEILRRRHEVDVKLDLTPEQLLTEIGQYEGLIVRSASKVTREVLEAGVNLKVVGRAGVGVDNIDLRAASERGVLVVNAPTGNCVAAAEHAVALLCSMARNVAAADATIKGGDWGRSKFVGVSLVDKTLTVLGLGRIGREVARRAKGLGMKVVAHDPFVSEEAASSLGIELMNLNDALKAADFLTLHMPLLDSTRNLISAPQLAMMKKGAGIVNAARGGIINGEALLGALESGHISGAALDCFENEPPHKSPDSFSNKLACHPKVVATPHLGASTKEAQEDVALEIAEAVSAALEGELVPTMVNAPSIPPEVASRLRPWVELAYRLGKCSYQLSGASLRSGEVIVTYCVADAKDDTRLLRAAVIKGLMESGVDVPINLVNANSVAKTHGLEIKEIIEVVGVGEESSITVSLKGAPVVVGRVTNSQPHLIAVGDFKMDILLDEILLMYTQLDKPGQLGKIGNLLGDADVNISDMTLARGGGPGSVAMVFMRLDSLPNPSLIQKVGEYVGSQPPYPLILNYSS